MVLGLKTQTDPLKKKRVERKQRPHYHISCCYFSISSALICLQVSQSLFLSKTCGFFPSEPMWTWTWSLRSLAVNHHDPFFFFFSGKRDLVCAFTVLETYRADPPALADKKRKCHVPVCFPRYGSVNQFELARGEKNVRDRPRTQTGPPSAPRVFAQA